MLKSRKEQWQAASHRTTEQHKEKIKTSTQQNQAAIWPCVSSQLFLTNAVTQTLVYYLISHLFIFENKVIVECFSITRNMEVDFNQYFHIMKVLQCKDEQNTSGQSLPSALFQPFQVFTYQDQHLS